MPSTITELLWRCAGFVALAGALLVPLEALWPRQRAQRTWAIDVTYFLLGAMTLRFVVGPALDAVTWSRSRDVHRLGLAFFGAEVMAYLVHRAMHEVPWLYRFHRVHHEPKVLDWLKAWRQHPVDVALHAFAVAVPGVLLGAPLSGLAGLVLVRRLYTGFLHANVSFRFGWLEHVIATPRFHHGHHEVFEGNYAGLFPWIDRIFGTLKSNRCGIRRANESRFRSEGREVAGAGLRRRRHA
ncbi:MAG TPA: sterol desaturase family protein [Archangium sp.]